MAKAIIPIAVRKFVIERAEGLCEYCQSQEWFSPQPFTFDHIVPVSKKGDNGSENLARACQGCNSSKLAKTEAFDMVTNAYVPLFNPRTQNWGDHFAWDETFTQILGLTPIGRATVVALKLNRQQLVGMREFLVGFGKHPPETY